MSIIIHMGNATSRVETDRQTMFMLDTQLAVQDPGAQFAKKYRPGWDGYWHFLSATTGEMPTGLVPRLIKLAPLAHINDKRVRPPTLPFNPNILRDVNIQDHQAQSIKAALDNGYGIIGASVGSGKTEIGAAIGCHVHGMVVWVTHRKELLRQTAERIEWRTGEKACLIGDGAWDEPTPETKFVIVMPQTALQDHETFRAQVKRANVMIVDEAHTASAANEWYKLSMLIPSYYRIGLTGTPEIGDAVRERRLEAATGPVLVRFRSSDMAKIGWVVPAKVRYHKVHNVPLHGVDYMTARRLLIEENPERNAIIAELAIAAARNGRPCLIICDTIKHAKLIAEVLAGESVRSRLLTGKHTSAVRSEAKRDIKTGALEVAITTPIWDLGVDIPELEEVILAAGGKSGVRVIQRAGRVIRRSPGKQGAVIHDFVDTGSRYTMKHTMMRMQACRKEGFELIGAESIPQPAVPGNP